MSLLLACALPTKYVSAATEERLVAVILLCMSPTADTASVDAMQKYLEGRDKAFAVVDTLLDRVAVAEVARKVAENTLARSTTAKATSRTAAAPMHHTPPTTRTTGSTVTGYSSHTPFATKATHHTSSFYTPTPRPPDEAEKIGEAATRRVAETQKVIGDVQHHGVAREIARHGGRGDIRVVDIGHGIVEFHDARTDMTLSALDGGHQQFQRPLYIHTKETSILVYDGGSAVEVSAPAPTATTP